MAKGVFSRSLRVQHVDPQKLRTIWFSDGRSFPAQVTKVEKDGIYITGREKSGFVKAAELCTAGRVRYGFGSRKEEAWVARLHANLNSAPAR